MCPICELELKKVYIYLLDDYGPVCESLYECPEKHYYEEFSYGYFTVGFKDSEKRFGWGVGASIEDIKEEEKLINQEAELIKNEKA